MNASTYSCFEVMVMSYARFIKKAPCLEGSIAIDFMLTLIRWSLKRFIRACGINYAADVILWRWQLSLLCCSNCFSHLHTYSILSQIRTRVRYYWD